MTESQPGCKCPRCGALIYVQSPNTIGKAFDINAEVGDRLAFVRSDGKVILATVMEVPE